MKYLPLLGGLALALSVMAMREALGSVPGPAVVAGRSEEVDRLSEECARPSRSSVGTHGTGRGGITARSTYAEMAPGASTQAVRATRELTSQLEFAQAQVSCETAARALARNLPDGSSAPLLELAQDPASSRLQVIAATSLLRHLEDLGRFSGGSLEAPAGGVLREVLADGGATPVVASLAAASLARLGTPDERVLLVEHYANSTGPARQGALRGLAELRCAASTRLLVQRIVTDSELAPSGAAVLARIASSQAARRPHSPLGVVLCEALSTLATNRELSTEVRSRALVSLGPLRVPGALEALAEVAQGEDRDLARAAFDGLALSGFEGAGVLVGIFHAGHADRRLEAATRLSRTDGAGPGEVAAALSLLAEELSSSSDSVQRRQAIVGLHNGRAR